MNKLEDNAQHAYWSELVFKYKVPFVKRELVLSDPSKFLKNCNQKLSDESLDIIDDGLKFRLNEIFRAFKKIKILYIIGSKS